MIVTMTNPGNGRKWRLRPYANGLCFLIEKSPIGEVNKKNGQKIKSDFVSCDKYPMTLANGIRMMMEMLLADPEDKTQIDIETLMDTSDKVSLAISRRIDEIIVEVEK